MAGLFDKIRDAVERSRKSNHDNPEVRTAPGSVFDRIKDKIEDLNRQEKERKGDSKNLFDLFRKKMDEVKVENEANPDEETADASVFKEIQDQWQAVEEEECCDDDVVSEDAVSDEDIEKMRAEIERMNQGPSGASAPPSPAANSRPPVATPRTSGMGFINSTGSIVVRTQPDMGAAKLTDRIPAKGQVQVLEHSTANPINLDGKISNWTKVNYNGQQGWILDSYVS